MAEPRFHVRAGPPLDWCRWTDHAAVFDPASGDTHVLDAVAAEALTAVSTTAHSARDLAAHLAATFDVPIDDPLVTYTVALLGQFETLGLVIVERA